MNGNLNAGAFEIVAEIVLPVAAALPDFEGGRLPRDPKSTRFAALFERKLMIDAFVKRDEGEAERAVLHHVEATMALVEPARQRPASRSRLTLPGDLSSAMIAARPAAKAEIEGALVSVVAGLQACSRCPVRSRNVSDGTRGRV